jgi:hypothetical protein
VGFFQRIQVFALYVFDQSHDGGIFIRHFTHQDRHFGQAGQLRGAEAAFAGDDFILAGGLAEQWPHEDGLHDPLGGY